MEIVCLDLEGVLIPEIWIGVAERTGIESLKATTRDIPDYDRLMRQRLDIMDKHGLGIEDVQAVIDSMRPMDGAKGFLNWLNERYQVIILSDTFYEFAHPLMRRLGWPTLFCHRLEITGGRISGYRLRMADHKSAAVRALKDLNFRVYAAGDSYNDTGMLGEADSGFLFQAPDNVIAEFPDFKAVNEYGELQEALAALSAEAG